MMIHWTTSTAAVLTIALIVWAIIEPPQKGGILGNAFEYMLKVVVAAFGILVVWLCYAIYW